MIFIIVLYAAIVVLMIASQWKVFEKAGQPGWACLIPIYNVYIMTQIAKKPGWWLLMLIVPIANIVFMIMLLNGISKAFGKTEGFTAGLIFLGIVFWPILAFGDASYQHDENKKSDELLDS